ncbi:MAG: serine protease [Prochloraceae cyanobacterium]|nr:serine protease [Prochloraceae cyanobacterium]
MFLSNKHFAVLSLVIAIALSLGAVKTNRATSTIDKVAQGITVRIEGTGRGTGVIVRRANNKYTVITNAHVLQKPGVYGLVTSDGKCYSIASDTVRRLSQIDLATFVFSSSISYPIAALGNSDRLAPGNTVYVGGWASSGGRLYSRVFLVSKGELTEVNSQLPWGYSLSYTNLVRVGMSGGPILDRQGQLVGINGLVRLVPNSDQIVASGIEIEKFSRSSENVDRKVSLPSSSEIDCPVRYIR